ncbi:MAG TPA: preprotein translocase subunit SecG [Firmicutes bacterium]|nr:preprotein translocase subunit SecG [Bacillota bacterium]
MVISTVLIVLEFVFSIALIVMVVLQQAKGEGLGVIGGGGQLFFTKNKGLEAFLEKATTRVAAAFLVVSVLFALV